MKPFDIVLVPFPFANLSATKKRPCLVLSCIKPKKLGAHYVLAMMTSNVSALSFPGDVNIINLKFAGLPKPTLVRLAKIVTVEKSLIQKQLGTLATKDRDAVCESFRKLFSQCVGT